jgi:hypothetical protein
VWSLLCYRLLPFGWFWARETTLALPFLPFWLVSSMLDHSCIHGVALLHPFRVRKTISRSRSYPVIPISRSQDHLAFSFEPFQTRFAFARPSRVLVRTLSDPFRVRKTIPRTRLHPFSPVSCSQEFPTLITTS